MDNVPLTALRSTSKSILAAGLNSIKWLPSDNGLNRDYRGLAEFVGVDSNRDYSSCEDPTSAVLSEWSRCEGASFGALVDALSAIDRFDVHDDVVSSLEEDRLAWESSPAKTCDASPDRLRVSVDENCITRGDVQGLQNGTGLAVYDAFILFADVEQDAKFASEIVTYLEDSCGMNLCLKERDLLAGIAFEHEAVTKLIELRCRHLIIVLSEEFFKSPECKFYTKFAQALSIEKRARVVLPIRYKKMEPGSIPSFLTGVHHLDYTRAMNGRWSFWDKLRDSVRDSSQRASEKSKELDHELMSQRSEEVYEKELKLEEKNAIQQAVSLPATKPDITKSSGKIPVLLKKMFKKPVHDSTPSNLVSSDIETCGSSSTMLLKALPDPPSGLVSGESDEKSVKCEKNKSKSWKGKVRKKLGQLTS